MKLGAVCLFVDNISIMARFYRDIMKMNTDWDGGPFAAFKTDSIWMNIFSREDFENIIHQRFNNIQGLNGTMELSFDVPDFSDVDNEFDRLVNAGVKSVFKPTTMPWGQRICFVSDPEGNLIEICSFGKEE